VDDKHTGTKSNGAGTSFEQKVQRIRGCNIVAYVISTAFLALCSIFYFFVTFKNLTYKEADEKRKELDNILEAENRKIFFARVRDFILAITYREMNHQKLAKKNRPNIPREDDDEGWYKYFHNYFLEKKKEESKRFRLFFHICISVTIVISLLVPALLLIIGELPIISAVAVAFFIMVGLGFILASLYRVMDLEEERLQILKAIDVRFANLLGSEILS
jgi:hypothetical protein